MAYWMFKCHDPYNKDNPIKNPYFCLKNDVISYGWSDYNLANNPGEGLKGISERDAFQGSIARNFTWINVGDIVILPHSGKKPPNHIAVGKIIKKVYRPEYYDHDASNTCDVKWLVKKYNGGNLSPEFKDSLCCKGTFNNLEHADEINHIIELYSVNE